MAEQPKRTIVSGHRGGMTDWAMVEVAANLPRPKVPPSDMDRALEYARLNCGRPPIIEQIARVRAEG